MRKDPVQLIAVADLHLTLNPPLARQVEKDWLAVQRRYLESLADLAHGEKHEKIIVYAGDIFDKPTAPNELVNFVIEFLPFGYAVPGNHDLPFHNYADLNKTPFWTLIKAGKLKLLPPNVGVKTRHFTLWGYPCGTPTSPCPNPHSIARDIAVVHSYCWTGEHGYPDAKESELASSYRKRLRGYDLAIFGDNHVGFCSKPEGKMPIINCGGLMRRKRSEIDYTPSVWLVHESLKIERRPLDVSADKFASEEQVMRSAEQIVDMSDFIAELASTADNALDFKDAIVKAMRHLGVSKPVRNRVLEALESHDVPNRRNEMPGDD